MGEFDLDDYQLYQLLSGESHAGALGGQEGPAASFFQPHPQQPQAPMLGRGGAEDQWVVDPAGYVAADGFSTFPQPLQIPGGGMWEGNDGGFVQQGGGDWKGSGGVPQGESWAAGEAEDYSVMLGGDAFLGNDQSVMLSGDAFLGNDQSVMLSGDAFLGNDQSVHGGGVPGVQEMLMSGFDLSKLDDAVVDALWASAMMDSLTADQAAAHPSGATNYAPPMVYPAEPNQASATASPGLMPQMPAYPPAMDYQQAPPMVSAAGPSQRGFGSSGPSTQVGAPASPGLMPQMPAYPPVMDYQQAPVIVPAAGSSQQGFGSSGPSTQVGTPASPGLASQMPAYHPAMDYLQAPPMLPAAEPNQVSAAASPGMMPAYPPAMNYPQAASNIPQAVLPDDEKAEVSQMVRAAARCGDDKESRVWSEEENKLLREGLSRFAGQDNVTKCFNIASGLAKKTVIDVAYRIRWLSDLEKRAAKQARLEQEKSAEAKVTKGKGTKGASRRNNKYPLSKEVLNSKSVKDLIRDNDRLMNKIEEFLETGQVKNCPEFFYYVKMNMDALRNKVPDLATVLEGLSVDDEEWENVLKDRHSLAGKDTTTPP